MAQPRQKMYLLAMVYIVGVGLGTAVTLWMKDDLADKMEIYRLYFQENPLEIPLNTWDYFIYIARQRFWSMGLLILFSFTTFAYPCLCAFSLYYGFCIAGAVVITTASNGMMGFLFFFLSLMPHYMLYIAAVLMIAYTICYSHSMMENRKIQRIVVSIIFFGIGMILEVYCNPILLKYLNAIIG